MIILNTQYIPAYPIPPVQIFHVAHLPEFWTGLIDMDWPYIYWLYVYILTWIGHTYWHAMAINMLAIYILTCIDMLTIYIGTDWPYTHTLDMVSDMVKELIKCVEIECYSCKTLPDF